MDSYKYDPSPAAEAPWSTGLCDCFSDMPSCCISYWVPCVTFGQVSEIAAKGKSSCCVNGTIFALLGGVTHCTCCYAAYYRHKLRKNFMIEGNYCEDCCVHTFLGPCALCQEYRELQHRGFDMSLGWQANMEKQNCGVVMPPTAQGSMTRD